MQDYAAFFFKVAERPDVVVAGEEVHLYAHVRQFGQLAQKACVAFGHDVFVLIPEVEHVAQKVYGGGLVLYVVKEAHQPSLLRACVVDGP